MESWLVLTLIAAVTISIVGSVLVVIFVWKGEQKREGTSGALPSHTPRRYTAVGRRWSLLIAGYLLVCLIFLGVILYQSGQGMEDRVLDGSSVVVGAVFFTIQALLSRGKAVRRARATVHTTATLVGRDSSLGVLSERSIHYSTLTYPVEGVVHRVRVKGWLKIEKGAQLDLYYAPDVPQLVYVPDFEKLHGWLFPAVLYLYGTLFPMLGLLAPLFR